MGFNSNNTDYTILTEAEITSILNNFDEDMIYDIVETSLNNKYRDYTQNLSNIVYSLENNFKMQIEQYGIQELQGKRISIYNNIIKQLCEYHNLQFNEYENIDYYSAAFYLYDFLVAKFSENITIFIINYIIKEQDSIYNLLSSENKKTRDASSVYSKKIYKANTKLALIHAFLGDVIDNICEFDISLEALLDTIYFGNKQVSTYISTIITEPEGEIFKRFIVPFIKNYKPIVITNVRLGLQEMISE